MSYESDAKFKEIVDRSIMGLLVQCEVCGKKFITPLETSEMSLRERLANGDEELRHFIETAGFKITNIYEDPINIWSLWAYEKGGHSSYKALKHIIIYKNPEDGKWMECYGENQREIMKRLLGNGLFDEEKDSERRKP